ncbi:MAG: hypothetical protein KBD37_08115 [Burkholderiales bacterium]|nr:hypothetical protein [Burkholderiales bacterium]
MNPIQMAIIAFVVIVILLTLGYYWYDDARFKRKVESNFNQATKDALTDENKITLFDSVGPHLNEHNSKFMQKDIAVDNHVVKHDPLLGEVPHKNEHSQHLPPKQHTLLDHNLEEKVSHVTLNIPDDSVEAFFMKLDKLDFPFANEVNLQLDLVIDIVFEESKKLKVLPEITQFTPKHFVCYVMDKDNVWQVFEKGHKYQVKAIKLVVQLLDSEGVISQAQIENIYNELHKFVIKNDAHIRCSDYETSIRAIQEQIKSLNNIELVLELYLLIKDKANYLTLSKFFNSNGLVENQGYFNCIEEQHILYTLTDENQMPLAKTQEYNMFSIIAKLHLHKDPFHVLDKIFDLGEKVMSHFEARLLTTNKQVITQKEYEQLYDYVKRYVDSARKKHIQLGGDLITRLFMNT